MNIKRLYSKVRRRIQNQLYRMRKRGFDTSNIKLPQIPKKITEGSIRRLEKQFSTEKLYEKATYYRPDTGEIIPGKKGRALRRRQAGEKRKKSTPVEQPKSTIVEPEETLDIPTETVSIETEYNIMVDQVKRLIEGMYPCRIPNYAPACADAATQDFENWLSGKSQEEVVLALREWDMLEISQRFFDSDDAKLFCHDRIVAQHLASVSATIKDDLSRIDDEAEEWIESESDEFFSEVFFNQ